MPNKDFRVLIVENDEEYRDLHAKYVVAWGWVPIIAQGQGEALTNDALCKIRSRQCHSAIVDMRLLDDDDLGDIAGLKLVKEMSSILCVVVTGEGDLEIAREAGSKYQVFRMIEKIKSLEKTQTALEEAFRIWSSQRLQIAPPERIKEIQSKVRNRSGCEISNEEIYGALNVLFSETQILHLETISGGTKISSGITRGKSVVLIARADNKKRVIVKLAPLQDIEQEVSNYNYYIRDRIEGVQHAQLKKVARLWGIGGTTFDFLNNVDGNLARFTDFYNQSNDSKSILVPIRFFHSTIWSQFYEETKQAPLFDTYNRLWKNVFEKTLDVWHAEQVLLDLPQGQVLNPRHWLSKNNTGFLEPIDTCVVHGDLHGDNLFVNKDQCWIIDFERTQSAHILTDFVELEKDILCRIAKLHYEQDFNTLYHLFLALTEFDFPNVDDSLIDVVARNREATKAFEVIKELRNIAESTFPNRFDLREYLWGVLLNCMFMLAKLESQLEMDEIKKTELLASIICQRLEQWGRTHWKPSNWPPSGPTYESDQTEDQFEEQLANLLGRNEERIMERLASLQTMLEHNDAVSEQRADELLTLIQEAIVPLNESALAEISIDKKELTDYLENTRYDARHRLKFTWHIVPTLLAYESEIELGAGETLRQLWESIKSLGRN